jgi:hypothetical protein
MVNCILYKGGRAWEARLTYGLDTEPKFFFYILKRRKENNNNNNKITFLTQKEKKTERNL